MKCDFSQFNEYLFTSNFLEVFLSCVLNYHLNRKKVVSSENKIRFADHIIYVKTERFWAED